MMTRHPDSNRTRPPARQPAESCRRTCRAGWPSEGRGQKLTGDPGVYRMLNGAGDALYVGKARNLARRVTSYTQPNRLSNRLMRMVSETESLEVIVTRSEIEALLLESNLIKKLKPRYNILLRDDKSLPQILLTADHPFGQLTKHRGRKTRKGDYFGPSPRPAR